VRKNKNPASSDGIYPFGSDGHGTLTGYAILPRKTEYQQVVKALMAITSPPESHSASPLH
jgi:hypothetical protein